MNFATNEVVCPKCKRIERANVEQERIKACSRCALAMAEKAVVPPEPKEKRVRLKLKRLAEEVREKQCKECGDTFTPQSRGQQYCKECHEMHNKMSNQKGVSK